MRLLPWSIAAWLLVAALSLFVLGTRSLDVAMARQQGLRDGLDQCGAILKGMATHQGRK
jgi:hypothetical protein